MIKSISVRQNARASHTLVASIAVLAAMFVAFGCSSAESAGVARVDMGQRVLVDDLEYTVLDAVWTSSLGDGAEARIPTNEYLLLRVAVSNTGGETQNMAAFKLIASDGTEYAELADGRQAPGWLGLSRSLSPDEARQGTVLFDAPRAVYQLQAAGEFYDGETGSAALIHIPIRMQGAEPAIPVSLE